MPDSTHTPTPRNVRAALRQVQDALMYACIEAIGEPSADEDIIVLPHEPARRIERIKALLDDMQAKVRGDTGKARAAVMEATAAAVTDPVLAIEAKRQKANLTLADLQPDDPRYDEALNTVSALDHAMTRTAASTVDGLRAQVDALARHHAGNAVEADQIETLKAGLDRLVDGEMSRLQYGKNYCGETTITIPLDLRRASYVIEAQLDIEEGRWRSLPESDPEHNAAWARRAWLEWLLLACPIDGRLDNSLLQKKLEIIRRQSDIGALLAFGLGSIEADAIGDNMPAVDVDPKEEEG